MEGSQENTTTYTIINDEGLLEYVVQITNILFESPNSGNSGEDLYFKIK